MFCRRVVKKVTACPHNVSSGSSSAAITGSRNMIFCHSVVKKVTACHHGSSSTEINATAIMTPATGVKKATACHDIVGGSSSTEIDVTTNMFPGTVVTGTNTVNQQKVGFQHVYKENETWREMESTNIIEKVQISFGGWGRKRVHTGGKRKAVHMLHTQEKNDKGN